uniref:Uncharacterized protein n=1 Tax=Cacopsylla melanoneura TaxID=428564 RepID=A0A8D8XB29_9HEMI
MTYTNKRTKIEHTYRIGNKETKEVDTINDLGITLNSNLTWGPQIEKVTQKAYKKLGMVIRFCQPIKDIDTITLLYKSLVRSTIEYGSVVWYPKTKINMKTVERIQGQFVRYLFQKAEGFYPKYPTYIDYKTLIDNLPIDSIEERFTNNLLKLLHNIIHNSINSPYLLTEIKFRVPNPRLRNNPTQLFYIPNQNNNNLSKSPLIFAMEKYNATNSNQVDLFIV